MKSLEEIIEQIEINDFGGAPVCTHNMPCAVCLKNHAVYNLSDGWFAPCRVCQKNGFVLHKSKSWIGRKIIGALT